MDHGIPPCNTAMPTLYHFDRAVQTIASFASLKHMLVLKLLEPGGRSRPCHWAGFEPSAAHVDAVGLRSE